MTSLPVYSQHLLVLLFGTFRVIATTSVVNETNMTAQALGVRWATYLLSSSHHLCCIPAIKENMNFWKYFTQYFRKDLFCGVNKPYKNGIIINKYNFFSVAPSFFHTCVSAGKTARMEDVERFKVSIKFLKVTLSQTELYIHCSHGRGCNILNWL